jgi:hypothetical protein
VLKEMKLTALSSLINEHFSRKKIHPTRSYLRTFYRQAAPNFAYLFIIFDEKLRLPCKKSYVSFVNVFKINQCIKSNYYTEKAACQKSLFQKAMS